MSWDATPRSTFSLTYRYQDHLISEGQGTAAHNIPIPANNTTAGEVTIHENGGIFTAALRPASNWDLNGSVEVMYNDNVFTPMGSGRSSTTGCIPSTGQSPGPRSPAPSTTWSGTTTPTTTRASRATPRPTSARSIMSIIRGSVSFGTELFPNDHYGLDLNYSYSDVYMADNICFQGAATAMPGGTSRACRCNSRAVALRPCRSRPWIEHRPLRASQGFRWTLRRSTHRPPSCTRPIKKLHSNLGYRVNSVNGSRFFTDAGDVNGSLVSNYQTPFVNVCMDDVTAGLIWKAEYDYFGYGEGGRSGAQYCNANPALAVGTTDSAPVVPCSSVANTAMSSGTPVYGFTAPRNFHANNVVLGSALRVLIRSWTVVLVPPTRHEMNEQDKRTTSAMKTQGWNRWLSAHA